MDGGEGKGIGRAYRLNARARETGFFPIPVRGRFGRRELDPIPPNVRARATAPIQFLRMIRLRRAELLSTGINGVPLPISEKDRSSTTPISFCSQCEALAIPRGGAAAD